MKKWLGVAFMAAAIVSSSVWAQVADQHLLGRWYSEDTRTSDPDEDNIVTTMKICASEEYFRNHISNFQGAAHVDYATDDASMEGGAVISFRGAAEWQLAESVLTSKIIDIKIRVKEAYLRRSGDDVDAEELETFKQAISTEMNGIFYVGRTSEDTVLSYNKNQITTESTDEDGVKTVSQHVRTAKLLEGCK